VSIGRASSTVGRFGPLEPSLDHLVYAVPDLPSAARHFADLTGVAPAEGGRHLGRGTRNVLVGFGDTSYLEIIGPDLENPADADAVVPFGVDESAAPRLVTWAVQRSDLDRAAATSAAAGADLGEPWPLSRRHPSGELLSWRLASVHPPPLAGVTPFLIDWGATAHPASSLPRVGLRGLRAAHPDPGAVRRVLDALDIRLTVEAGDSVLIALLDTPRGPVVLS
jgi:hypothetical protein